MSKRTLKRAPPAVRAATGALSFAAPPLAALLAERMFLRPPARPLRSLEARWVEQSAAAVFDTPTGRIEGRRWGGEGPTVLLAHGWGGRGGQLGGIGLRLAELGYSAVAWDMPGHGDTTRPTNLPEMGAAMAAIAGQVGPLAGVVTHSFGTATTLAASALHEMRVPRLAAVAPAAILHRIGSQFADLSGFSTRVVERMRDNLSARLEFEWEELEAATVAPRLEGPTLVIHDTDDERIPHEDGLAFARMLRNATTVSTTGLGHSGPLRDEDTIQTVADFFVPVPA